MRLWTLLWRSCRLRCPLCGRTKMFTGWFKMRKACDACGARYEREAGFFLGSIYFNYGLTALIVAVAYPILMFQQVVSGELLLGLCLAFVVLFPLWFFRYARSLWAGFDEYFDPRQGAGGSPTPPADRSRESKSATGIE